jgi:hypothetical protein
MIDNIFIDNRRSYTIKSCINGLSDHVAQLIIFTNIPVLKRKPKLICTRNINNNSMAEFQSLLSWERWDDIFGNNDVNIIFNEFHNTYLRCFYACFSKKRIRLHDNHNKWIANGIRISCNRKRELFLLSKHSNDLNLKIYFKQYCKILTKVISAAKKLHYNRIIAQSSNKMRSTWKIIN